MVAQILSKCSIFQFSLEFVFIPFKHMLEWMDNEEDLDCHLRKVRNNDGQCQHVRDIFVNSIIHKPVQLKNSML